MHMPPKPTTKWKRASRKAKPKKQGAANMTEPEMSYNALLKTLGAEDFLGTAQRSYPKALNPVI
jgi:hypothetical protein